jgi:hypothetical protein
MIVLILILIVLALIWLGVRGRVPKHRGLFVMRCPNCRNLMAYILAITSHVGLGQKAEIRSGGGMTHWTESAVVILLASFSGVASAQVDCDAIPHGPARTDCYLALSQFYRGQSDLAAARARVQSDAAWYRAITGTDPPKHRLQRQQ